MASLNEMINLHQYKYGRPQGGQSAFGVIADMLGQEAKIRQEKQAQIEEENRQLERAQRLQKLFNTADEQSNRINTDLEKADRSTDNPRVGASVVNIPRAAMSMASGGIGDAFGNPIPYSSQVAAQPQAPTVIPSRSQRYSLEPDISMAGGKMNVGVKFRDNQSDNLSLFKEAALKGIDPNGKTREQIYSELANANLSTEKADRLKNNDYFSKADKMRDDFDKLSKDYRLVRDAHSRIEASAKDPSAAGDLALIFNYMKVLDPGSTVREGEFATAQNSASVPDIIRAKYNKVISGERLATDQRADFVDRSRKLYKSQADIQNKNVNLYRTRAERFGVDPQDVITELDSVESLGGQSGQVSQGNMPTPEEASQAAAQGYTGYDTETGQWVK